MQNTLERTGPQGKTSNFDLGCVVHDLTVCVRHAMFSLDPLKCGTDMAYNEPSWLSERRAKRSLATVEEKLKTDKDVDGYGKRLRKQAELFKKFGLPTTDDEDTSDVDSDNEQDHHSGEEYDEENGFNAQEAWDNAYEDYDSDDEDNQQVPYQSQDGGRKVVHPPPKARSYRPKEPQHARPLPISPYLGGNGNFQPGQSLWLSKQINKRPYNSDGLAWICMIP